MLNDTFHCIKLGPKWKQFLHDSAEKTRRKSYITDAVRGMGAAVRENNRVRKMQYRRSRQLDIEDEINKGA